MYGIKTESMARCDAVDVCTWAQTYGQCETGKPYFHLPSHSSYFPYFRFILVELGLIEGFPQIWRTQAFRNIRRRLLIQVSFNLHNAHCYFSHALHIYFIYWKTCIFYNSLFRTYCTRTLSFWEKCCAEYVNQVRLVKWHACKIQTR